MTKFLKGTVGPTEGQVGSPPADAALKLRTTQLQAIAHTALEVARAPDLSATLATVTAAARSIIGAHQGVVSLTRGTDWSQAINSVDLTGKYAEWRDYAAATDGSGIYAWVCAENRPVRMTHAELEAHPRWKGFGKHAAEHPPMRGWLAAPLVARDGRNLGLIQLSDKEDGGEFDETDEALLVQLAQLASAAFEQAEAEEALRSSEARFRAAIDAVEGVLWTNDAEGRMVGEQPGWARLTGHSRAEYEGFGWAAAVHPDDAQPTIDAWLNAVEERRPFVFEHRLRRADGEWRRFFIRAIPVLDASGAIREWVGVHTDVTELRSQERALQDERDRVWTYFEQAPSLMAVVRGEEHVFELVNEAYRQIVGHRELIGRTLREAFPEAAGQGADGVEFFDLYDQIFATGKAYVGRGLRVELQRVAGGPLEERYVDSVMQPIRERDGSVSGILVNGVDVTHRKRAEAQLHRLNEELEERVAERTRELSAALDRVQAEVKQREAAELALRQSQRLESLGKLTGGVAHDFNNLLQVISGNLQLLTRDIAGNPRAETRVQNALSGVGRGAKLASQLLAFGRRQALEPRVVNPGRLLKNMDDLLHRAIGEDVQIETIVGGGLWNTLVDPGQVENAILNLAINARDAMPGGGRLTIEAGNASLDDEYARRHEEVEPGQYVMVAVTDTGGGIPGDILDRVFDPFFTTKPEGKGTGLGLSMVHGFAKQSGGHIKIYSEVGEGTTVKLYLPRALAAEDVAAEVDTGPVRGGTETILVAEDDDGVRETAVGLLSELGYRVLKARDAQSALNIVESGLPIDLLFTDVVMPGPMRSPELAKRARERLPGIAVLFTSGYTENAIVHHGRLDPGVDLLAKPYTREAMARKVRLVLANRAQQMVAEARLTDGGSRPEPLAAEKHGLKVLLVEDDDLIRASTGEMVTQLGYTVATAPDAETALRLLENFGADILLADISLPGRSGAQLARSARERINSIQVVFATGDESGSSTADMPSAIVLTKPYQLSELQQALSQARMRINRTPEPGAE